MNRFPNILGEILNIEEEDNNDVTWIYCMLQLEGPKGLVRDE